MKTSPGHRQRASAARLPILYATVAGVGAIALGVLLARTVDDPGRLAFFGVCAALLLILVSAFLLHASAQGAPTDLSEGAETPKARTVVAAFLTLAALAAVAGYGVFRHQEDMIKRDTQSQLATLADLKVRQIAAWLSERRRVGEVVSRDPFLASQAQRWFQFPDEATRQQLLVRLNGLRTAFGHRAVMLRDGEGTLRLAVGDADDEADERGQAQHAVQTGQVSVSDLHAHDAPGGRYIEIETFAPLLRRTNGGAQAVGAVQFKVDAREYLYPLVESWPGSSVSAETLLARRDGEGLLYLNELRHRPGSALKLRMPADTPLLAMGFAAKGGSGLFEGEDYRGVPVLAAVRRVPGTDWMMVAKVDRAEVYAPVRRLALTVAAMDGVFVLGLAVTCSLWWRQQRARSAAERYRSELERRVLQRRLDYLAKYVNDVILLVDERGRIIDANDRAASVYGYDRDELLALSVADLRAGSGDNAIDEIRERARQNGGGIYGTVHRRRDGSTLPVEVSVRVLEIDGRPCYQAVVRDVSERRKAEEAMRAGEERLRLALEAAHMLVWEWDAASGRMVQYGDPRDVWGVEQVAEPLGLIHPEDRPKVERAMSATLRDGRQHGILFRAVHPQTGAIRWIEDRGKVIRDAGGQVRLCGILIDVTERKRAEEALRLSEEHFRIALKNAPISVFTQDRELRYTWVYAPFSGGQMLGRRDADLMPEEDAEPLGRLKRMVLESGVGIHEEVHILGRYYDLTLEPLRDAQGQVEGISGAAFEITHQKQAQDKLRLAARVFASAAEGIVVTDRSNHIVSVNRAFTEITGYAEEEVLGKNPKMLSSGRQDDAFYQAMWEAIHGSGYWHGELWNRRKGGEVYPQWAAISTVRDGVGQITNYVAIFSDITERKAAAERIQFLAHYDPLTRLPNRFLLRQRLEAALQASGRNRRQLALLFLDLDRFKTINDTLGHDAGDQLLQAVAERLRGCVREEDTVARLGGDEFVIVLTELREPQDAALVAQKVIATVGQPCLIAGHHLSTSPSIGIAVFPVDGQDMETLVKHADVAMYHAKAGGRNDYQFFRPEMNQRALEHLTLENSLRRALERQEFMLGYQAQVAVATGAVTGAEALLCWRHPERGLLAASDFIGIAEESGLITRLGMWALHSACLQGRRWQEEGLQLRMGVNVSAVQLRQKDFAGEVRRVLRDTSLEAGRLELELTESAIMTQPEIALETLQALASMGVHIAIDDFGTGYSSLSYLKRFPIDTLKIDRSFVRDIPDDPEDAALTSAIIAMGKTLHMKVVAEGVETQEQAAFLRERECDEMQGYYFGRNLPAEEFASRLRQGAGWGA